MRYLLKVWCKQQVKSFTIKELIRQSGFLFVKKEHKEEKENEYETGCKEGEIEFESKYFYT